MITGHLVGLTYSLGCPHPTRGGHAHRVSASTLNKTLLWSVFDKVDVHRQADFMRLAAAVRSRVPTPSRRSLGLRRAVTSISAVTSYNSHGCGSRAAATRRDIIAPFDRLLLAATVLIRQSIIPDVERPLWQRILDTHRMAIRARARARAARIDLP
jgi:hypothetical protein